MNVIAVFETKSNDELKRGTWNLDLQPQKISYFHYHYAYGHPTW